MALSITLGGYEPISRIIRILFIRELREIRGLSVAFVPLWDVRNRGAVRSSLAASNCAYRRKFGGNGSREYPIIAQAGS